MINKVLNLREKETGGFMPTLTTYVLDDPICQNRKFPAVLICPGGGYEFCSPREAEPIAMQFASAGFHSFVLNYSVAPQKYPMALEEASKAMTLIRSHAEEWNVDDDKIAICGFSAGGHLAASLGVFWNTEPFKTPDGTNKPNAMILGYPVITSGEFAHVGSFDNLCGDDEELRKKLSLENCVSEDTPPAFIWHTAADTGVPAENSLLFAAALRRKNIPIELHIYPHGAHGLSLANDYSAGDFTSVTSTIPAWVDLAKTFMKEIF